MSRRAYANLGIEMRARCGCASGPASPASRGLCLFEGFARFSAKVGRALFDCPRWPARLRRTAVEAPAFFPRICSGWGRGLSCSKSPLSYCICEIFILRKLRRYAARPQLCHRLFRKNRCRYTNFSGIFRNFSEFLRDGVRSVTFLHILFLVFFWVIFGLSSESPFGRLPLEHGNTSQLEPVVTRPPPVTGRGRGGVNFQNSFHFFEI